MRAFLFIVVFALLLASRIISYSSASWDIDSGVVSIIGETNRITAGLEYLSLGIGLYLALTSSYHNILLRRIKTSAAMLIMCVIFWFIMAIPDNGFVNTLYSPVSSLAYLPIFMLLIGGDEKLWRLLKSISPYMAIINILLSYSFYHTVVLGMGLRMTGNNPVTVYLVTTIWWIAVSIIDFYEKKIILKCLIYALLVGCGLIAFSMTTRSWMIQSSLLFILATLQLGKNRFSKLIIVVCAVIGIYYVIEMIFSSYSWSGEVEAFNNKNKIDTRSFQYEEMYEQVDLLTWIFGGGINATYKSQVGGNEYRYIDNQYIFTAFHYGVILLSCWLNIWLKPIVRIFKDNRFKFKEKLPMYICILWMCALGGLSVYNVIVINTQNMVMSIVLGRCMFMALKKYQ